MPAPKTKIQDIRDRLGNPTIAVDVSALRDMVEVLQAEEAKGAVAPGDAADALADIFHRLGNFDEAIAQADRAFLLTQSESAECMTAVARLRLAPREAVAILRRMIEKYGPQLVYSCNLAEGLARAGLRDEVPAALLQACAAVRENRWDDAHRVAYAAATAGDVPLCAQMLKRHLVLRGRGQLTLRQDAYGLVVWQRDWLASHSRWFPELDAAVNQMAGVLQGTCPPALSAPLWMDRVYRLFASSHSDEAIDLIYDSLEEMLDAGEFEAVNSLFLWAEPELLGAEGVVSFLIVTLGAKPKLPHRSYFLERARPLLEKEDEGADAVVAGLV